MAATDPTLKRIVRMSPRAVAEWLLGEPVLAASPRTGELVAPSTTIDTDLVLTVTLRDGRHTLLHIEFQGPGTSRPMPWRMLDYDVRIVLDDPTMPLVSVVIYLGGAGANDTGKHTLHDHTGAVWLAWSYRVIRLWDTPASELLALEPPTLAVLIGQTRLQDVQAELTQAIRQIGDATAGELRERFFTELLLL